MKKIPCLLLLTMLAGLLLSPPAGAQEQIEISYDIFSRNDSVTVWVDFAPFLSEGRMSGVLDGIDLIIDCQLKLAAPKRLWGETDIARTDRSYRISHRIVTEDFRLASSQDNWESGKTFSTESSLFRYLRDSIETAMIPLDSLDGGRKYTLETTVTASLRTEFSLTPPESDTARSTSPLQYLFEKFLSITGFGETTAKARSRTFYPSELIIEP